MSGQNSSLLMTGGKEYFILSNSFINFNRGPSSHTYLRHAAQHTHTRRGKSTNQINFIINLVVRNFHYLFFLVATQHIFTRKKKVFSLSFLILTCCYIEVNDKMRLTQYTFLCEGRDHDRIISISFISSILSACLYFPLGFDALPSYRVILR